jgi:asparagine synthase (glutamine-hydrolysing)
MSFVQTAMSKSSFICTKITVKSVLIFFAACLHLRSGTPGECVYCSVEITWARSRFQDEHNFLFASEIQALLASQLIDRELDTNALWHYLSLRFMPDRYSLLKNIQKLPAATTLSLKNGNSSLRRYWQPIFLDKFEFGERDATDALDECLRESVRMHLLSDVPVGAFISSGIDSTTISTMMARETPVPIDVFSIGVCESDYDELPMAQVAAEAAGMNFHSRSPTCFLRWSII